MSSISASPPFVEGTLCSHIDTIYDPGSFEYPLPRSILDTYLDGKALDHYD